MFKLEEFLTDNIIQNLLKELIKEKIHLYSIRRNCGS